MEFLDKTYFKLLVQDPPVDGVLFKVAEGIVVSETERHILVKFADGSESSYGKGILKHIEHEPKMSLVNLSLFFAELEQIDYFIEGMFNLLKVTKPKLLDSLETSFSKMTDSPEEFFNEYLPINSVPSFELFEEGAVPNHANLEFSGELKIHINSLGQVYLDANPVMTEIVEHGEISVEDNFEHARVVDSIIDSSRQINVVAYLEPFDFDTADYSSYQYSEDSIFASVNRLNNSMVVATYFKYEANQNLYDQYLQAFEHIRETVVKLGKETYFKQYGFLRELNEYSTAFSFLEQKFL